MLDAGARPSDTSCPSLAGPVPRQRSLVRYLTLILAGATLVACSSSDKVTAPVTSFKLNPCSGLGTVQLDVAQATRIDCSQGGTTVTVAGGGASYLVVPQFATDAVPDQFVPYTISTGNATAAAISSQRLAAALADAGAAPTGGTLPPMQPNLAQMRADRIMLQRSIQQAPLAHVQAQVSRSMSATAAAATLPSVGSIRSFHVLASFSAPLSWTTVGARLEYVGDNILLYVDTLAPQPGFTSTQLQNFGTYFDQTLYPIDTAAFGGPSDIDGNGRVIMVMSPVVNGDTSPSTCANNGGYIAGFFDTDDFSGPTNPVSNQGEVFYSIVPDPNAIYSCAHSVTSLGEAIGSTFVHELQHLINYSQHVVLGGGAPLDSWLDEGMSIIAEELGSLYFEQKCPPPSCRTSPDQLFPDSAQGFVQGFLYDSYQYALLPDTASITLHDDSQQGFSWRGGTWLLLRWLGDHYGSGIYKQMERGPANGIASIEQVTGQNFLGLFSDFGLALYTDSLPGLPRSTAPAIDRFTSRNMKQLWARLWTTSNGTDIPREDPVQLFAITTDTSSAIMDPGTMTYFRLDTPSTSQTVTFRFSAPGGTPFATDLHPQLAIFRLPAGQ